MLGSQAIVWTAICGAVVIGIAGCVADPVSPAVTVAAAKNAPQPDGAAAELRAAAGGRQLRGVEDEILRMENAIPGIGGMFLDSSGVVTVYVARTSDSTEVRSGLARIAPTLRVTDDIRRQLGSGGRVKLIKGDFPFSQLVAWQADMGAQVKPGDGIFGIDADESTNRLRVFVTKDVNDVAVQEVADKAGIPRDALTLEIGEPPQMTSGLRGTWRPTGGGVQLSTAAGICTIGFNVTTGDLTHGFLTASHCAGGNGGAVGGTAYQPIAGYPVGWIRWNPVWNSTDPGCMGYTTCTDADAMYVQYTDPGLAAKRVAFTAFVGTNNAGGSITVTGWWQNIVAPFYPLAGQALDKVGMLTGWTRGALYATCVDLGDPVSQTAHLCSGEIAGSRVGQGDSGSPIFIAPAQASQSLYPVGILWGTNPSDLNVYDPSTGAWYCDGGAGTCITYYSNWARVQTHMQSPFYPN